MAAFFCFGQFAELVLAVKETAIISPTTLDWLITVKGPCVVGTQKVLTPQSARSLEGLSINDVKVTTNVRHPMIGEIWFLRHFWIGAA